MSKVLQFFREDIDPRFKDVSDRELTKFIKNEYPDFSIFVKKVELSFPT